MVQWIDQDARVEPLSGDVLAIAQTHALDAAIFPRASLPEVLVVPGTTPVVWIARAPPAEGPPRDSPVVGFCATQQRGARLDVTHLAVHPAHRGAGLGRALLRAALAAARTRRMADVVLHVSTGNRAALALYESEGFEVVRRVHAFYPFREFPDGGDAYVMIRRA
jgi:ribosomal protein S18 acetylase RimI-like enzyme